MIEMQVEKIGLVLGWLFAIGLMGGSVLLITIPGNRPWKSPMSRREKWGRSMIICVGQIMLITSLSTAFALYKFGGNLSLDKQTVKLIGLLVCLFLPITCVISIVGSLARFNEIDREIVYRNELLKTMEKTREHRSS